MSDWQFYRHMPVFLKDGRRLGRTLDVSHSADMIHVQQGRMLVQDWYIPVDAIRDVDPKGVHLSVDRSDLRANAWATPPVEYLLQQGATPGYEYTNSSNARAYVNDGQIEEGTT